MSSPNFPNAYPNDVSQLWTITAPEGYGARFDIDVINIEDPFERLAIGTGHDPTDESSILGSWTGHHLLQNVTRISLQYQYWVSFKSDLTVREQGFVIAIYPVEFEEYSMTMECGELLNITSPNYPMTYPNSQILLWLITAPPQHGLYFRFARFDTESHRDMVIVGTGESPDAGVRITGLSGFITPSDIVSDDNKAWIIFRPDIESTEASGFFVEVRTVERPDCTASNAFQCPNGRCISTAALCDNYNDCQDFIDEEYCPICVDVPASCSQLLPYNMTYFPNQHAPSAADADSILGKVTSSCPQESSHLQLACNMLFPECPHHGPTRQPCKSSCMAELDLCAAVYEAQHGEEWPLICDSLPETEEDLLGRCTGPSADILHTSICGTRPAYNPYQPRVVGGVNAQEGEFPWMAYLYNEDYGQYCGATLISSEWIVTAAHCLWGITDLLDSVVMGDLHLSINSEQHLTIAPDDIFIHPEYNDTLLNADIALIKLSEHVSFSEYVRPACLSQTLHEETDYTTCIIAGWGNTEHDEADNLQKATVRLIEVERCKELYEVPDDYDTGYLVCAGFERGGIDTCQGDSGGPLVCEGADGRWHLTGVTSFGNGCADPGFPGIYARVSTLLPFLESILLKNLMETISLEDQDDEVQITSPGYPESYDANIDKTWYISAPRGYSISVEFLVFSLEAGFDVLTVYEGVTSDVEEREVSHRLTGYLPPPSFTSFGSHVWLQFTTDDIIQDQGFLLVVSLVKGIGTCSVKFTKKIRSGSHYIKVTIMVTLSSNSNYHGNNAQWPIKFKNSTEDTIE
nr:enteropeptidase-like [Lytechinus pictus]